MSENKINLGDFNDSKTIAIFSYLTVVGLIAAFVLSSKNPSSLSRFHIRQSLGITVVAMALSLLSMIPILGFVIAPLVGIFLLISWILGIISAINGEEKGLPVLGDMFQKWFSNI